MKNILIEIIFSKFLELYDFSISSGTAVVEGKVMFVFSKNYNMSFPTYFMLLVKN